MSGVALLCSRVVIEVSLSGIVATLSRDVTETLGAPMEIYGGEYDRAVKAPRSEWMRYPYRKSPSRESFSQAMFRLLGMPEVVSDISGNVTIHQMLRLVYADQLSPVDDLFRFERFDQASLRDTVGRLLCGAYSSSLYDNDQRIRVLTKEFDGMQAELRSLFAILGRNDEAVTSSWIEAERAVLAAKSKDVQGEIERAERELFSAKDEITLKVQNDAYTKVQELQAKLAEYSAQRDRLALTMADSASFIASLYVKIEALRDSESVASHIEEVRFQTCPACYAAIDGNEEASAHACHLCKTPFDAERARTRIAGLISEAAVQVKQSEVLQAKRQERLAALDAQRRELHGAWQAAARRLASVQRLPSSEARQRLSELNRQAGYLERQLEDLEQKSRMIQHVKELSDRKDSLNTEITRLRSENEALRFAQEKTLRQGYTLISNEVRSLLRGDLRRQDSFEKAEAVNFSFNDNSISIDGNTYFSASSRAILKSSFVLGFLAAAAKASFFRHPRFCMIDALENMGVEVQRSHNFQMQILKISEQLPSQHQIIFATAMIAPDLDDEAYTVGRFSTRDEPTLAIDA